MAPPRTVTLEECKKHGSFEDCWLIIDQKVYDVTHFLEDHPGGSEILVTATGRDATDDFEDVVHSTTARKQMEEFYIADLDAKDCVLLKASGSQQSFQNASASPAGATTSPVVTFLKAILPFLIVVCAYYFLKVRNQ